MKDEIAPTGKLRVAIGISPAGGAYWSTKTESGYAGVPVDLGKAMADQLGLPVEYVAFPNSGQITDAAAKGAWDVSFLPEDPARAKKIAFGPIYEVAEATYIVRAGSTIKDFATLDQPDVKVAAVNDTTTMRGAVAHLKNAKVTGYQTFDEIFNLLKNGEIDAFALSRDQLNALSKKIPGSRVLDETFKQTVTAVAVPLNHPLSLEYASKFMTDAKANGLLRKAYDNNGLKDTDPTAGQRSAATFCHCEATRYRVAGSLRSRSQSRRTRITSLDRAAIGSRPLLMIVSLAAGEARNLISALPASGSFEPVAMPAENTVIFCNFGGSGPTISMP